MSLEWARARALQDEIKLRRLVRSADGTPWTELAVPPHCSASVWLQPAALRVVIESQPRAASEQT
jgi:hypothetical protein